jgi:hypothetical protein
VSLTCGGSEGSFDVSDQIVPGGREQGGDTMHGVDALLPAGTLAGLVDLSVVLQMKIIAEV